MRTRRLTSLLIALILLANGLAAQIADAQRQIKRSEQYRLDSIGAKYDRFVEEFNKDGLCTYSVEWIHTYGEHVGKHENIYTYNDNQILNHKWSYNGPSYLMTYERYDSADSSILIIKYDNGYVKQKQSTWTDHASGLRYEVITEYDADRTITMVYHQDGYLLKREINWDGPNARTETETFENEGRTSKVIQSWQGGGTAVKSLRERDSNGNYVSYSRLSKVDSLNSRHEWSYFENGLESQRDTYKKEDGEWVHKTTRTYKYEYDWLGNWIKRREYVNDVLQKIVYRDLWYFD